MGQPKLVRRLESHMSIRTLAICLVAAFVATPTALAAWGARGSYEPDTARDRLDGWMTVDRDVTPTDLPTPVRKVYFNSWLGVYPVQPVNHNVAAVESSVRSQFYRTYAVLGVWKDCNNDGYVGLGDNGLWEYKAELLVDKTICPTQNYRTDSFNRIVFDSMPVHNDGQWVHEFLPIMWSRGNAETLGDTNAFNINANSTRIWGDFSLPENVGGGGGCPINPQPQGTMHSVGGLIWYADCWATASISRWFLTDTINTFGNDDAPGGLNLDELGLGQVTFDDKPRDQYASSSILNVKNPWGEEDQAAYTEVWDCGAPQPVSHKLSDTAYVNVSTPRVPTTPNPSGSPAGQMNSTFAGFDECERTTTNNGNAFSTPAANIGSHWGRTAARLPYTNEGATLPSIKLNPQEWMTPLEATRPAAPFATVLGRNTPNNFGITYVDQSPVQADGIWMGRTNWVNFLNAPNSIAGYVTMYAWVNPADVSKYGLSMPKGTATGVYGSERCATIGAGAPDMNGWRCDPTKWFIDPTTGNDVEPRSTYLGPGEAAAQNGVRIGTRVGAQYNLRDVDCYDNSAKGLRELGVGSELLLGFKCDR